METWDYGNKLELQNAWNQTLITKLNSISKSMGDNVEVKVPIKFKPIFDSFAITKPILSTKDFPNEYQEIAKANYLSKSGEVKEGINMGGKYYAPKNDI